MHSPMSKPTKEKLKKSSFIHHSRILKRQQPELLNHMPEPIPTHAAVPCWERLKFPTILTHIPGIKRKAAQSDPKRKSITMEQISANYPEEEWTQVYTDGSAIEATRNKGRGVYIKYRAEEVHISVAAGRYTTNFRAEAMAPNTAATKILANLDKTHKKVVFFSYALSVLDTLQNPNWPKNKEQNNLTRILSQLNDQVEVTFQWIPAHCRVNGNDVSRIPCKRGKWPLST